MPHILLQLMENSFDEWKHLQFIDKLPGGIQNENPCKP